MKVSRRRVCITLLGLWVTLTALGCRDGSERSCGPSNCAGCCGTDGTCWLGVDPATCGAGGQACLDCGVDTCTNGSCTAPVDCGVCKPKEVDYKGCGNCGTRTRVCTEDCSWGSWGDCGSEGPCIPNLVENQGCGNCGSQPRVCSERCDWGEWEACTGEGACAATTTDSQACGNCGTRDRVCTGDCTWGEWGACAGERECAREATERQACGDCQSQTKVCTSDCTWGEWGACDGGPICTVGEAETRNCGSCGTERRVCSDGCAWSDWGSCTNGIAWKSVRAIGTDFSLEVRLQGRTVWVGTTGGLLRSADRGLTWEAFGAAEGLAGDEAGSLAIDGSTVIVGTTEGLSYSADNGAVWNTVAIADGLPGNKITALLVASDHTFWVGTTAGLGHASSLLGPWVNFGVAQGLVEDRVETLAEGPDGSIWVGHISTKVPGLSVTSDGGLTWTHPDIPDDLGPDSENPVQTIFFDSQNTLWISTWGDGLYRSPDMGVSWTRFASSDYGKNDSSFVDDYYESPPGTIWMAAQGMRPSGISITQDSGATWIKRDNLCSHWTLSVAGDDLGRVYAASYGCGLSWTDNFGVDWSSVSLTAGIPSNAVTAVSSGPADSVWIGTFENFASYSQDGGKTWKGVSWPVVGFSNSVQSLFFDEQATPPRLWIATLSGLFSSTDGGATFEVSTSAHGLGADDVRSVVVDRSSGKEILWAATGSGAENDPGGVSKSTDGGISWVNFTRDDETYGSNNTTDVFVDHNGVVWAATSSGLRRSADQGATWETWIFKINSSVPAWDFSSVWVEPDGTIWIAGERANEEMSMAAAKSTDGGSTWTRFNVSTGLGVDDGGTRLYRDPKTGEMYLGTESGGAYWTRDQGASWCHVGTGSGLESDWVTAITVDDRGTVFLATRNGLAIGSAM